MSLLLVGEHGVVEENRVVTTVFPAQRNEHGVCRELGFVAY